MALGPRFLSGGWSTPPSGPGQYVLISRTDRGDHLAPTPTVPASFCRAKALHNAGEHTSGTVSRDDQRTGPWGWMLIPHVASGLDHNFSTCGLSHDRLAPFIAHQRRTGRMFPERFSSQHAETPLALEDYLASRWADAPAYVRDCGQSIQAAATYIPPTCEYVRAPAASGQGRRADGRGTD